MSAAKHRAAVTLRAKSKPKAQVVLNEGKAMPQVGNIDHNSIRQASVYKNTIGLLSTTAGIDGEDAEGAEGAVATKRTGFNLFEDDDLTAQQIAELKEAFSHYDKGGTGTIRINNLRSVMRSMGLNPTENEILDIMNGLDIDGDGEIELHEYIAIMLQKMQTLDSEAEIKKVFRVFDRDGNGFLSADELKYMMLDALGHNVTDEEVDEMLKDADIDGDGRLNYQEFVKMLLSD